MQRFNISGRILFFVLLLSVLGTSQSYAAILSIVPSASSITIGSTVTLGIVVNSEGVAINSGEGTLIYPRDKFDLVSINKDVSLFTLWIDAPASDGNGGVTFNGGVPSPGYQGTNGRLFNVTLRAKSAGSAAVSVVGGAVRANDGLGTDVLRSSQSSTISISEAATKAPASPVVKPTVLPVKSTVKPAAETTTIDISSPTHPSESVWYANASPAISWTVSSDIDSVQAELSQTSGKIPTAVYHSPISIKTFDPVNDGVWYFNIRAHTPAGWSSVKSYRLQIDTSAPVLNSLITYDATSSALFIQASAEDAYAGINTYQVLIDGTTTDTLSQAQFASGFVRIPVTSSVGTHTAVLRVFDNAGNYADSDQLSFVVPIAHTAQSNFFDQVRTFNYGSLELPAALLLSLLSLLMNFVLWNRLRRSEKLRSKDMSEEVKKVKNDTHEKLLNIKQGLEQQKNDLEKSNAATTLAPEDAAYIKKVQERLIHAQTYIDQTIKDVDSEG
ncbi:MAG: hypothetical protein JWO50_730 [Candidatus Kaiserbacteria bacterium]|nr:hypothetical protein [Candidatus Kaiserbacteria bacterium]